MKMIHRNTNANRTKQKCKKEKILSFSDRIWAENENCNGPLQGESQKVPKKWKFTENKLILSRSAGMCNINNSTKTACTYDS